MGLVMFIVAGAFVGWIVAAVQEVDEGVLARIGIGMLGALLGSLLFTMLGGPALTAVTWFGLLMGIVSATILLGIVGLSRSYKPHKPDVA